MAAAADHRLPEVVDLTRVGVEELDPLLDEECLTWHSALSWDFGPNAELVRRFVRIRSLAGYALRSGKHVIGYSYYVGEDRKGLIGDLYIARAFDTTANTDALLGATLSALIRTPGVERIEGQLMLAHGPFERPAPYGSHAQVYPRIFMLAELDETAALPSVVSPDFRIVRWDTSRHEEAATVIATAYNGHVDSRINDQYRSWLGARRFVTNVANSEGAGRFFGGASLMAVDRSERVCGVILATLVAGETGHIAQVCTMPEMRGKGLGYELIRRSLFTMREFGCERASLTVTTSNGGPVRLYQGMGFRAKRRFAAYVWDGF